MQNLNKNNKYSLIKDENGFSRAYENGILTEKNYYTPDGLYVIVEEGVFDEQDNLIDGKIYYREKESGKILKIIEVLDSKDNKINENFNYAEFLKIDLDKILKNNRDLQKDLKNIEEENLQEKEIFISQEEREIIDSLDDSKKNSILNEIHIEITNLVQKKIRGEDGKILRELYNDFQNIEKRDFLELYSKGTDILKKVGIEKDFLREEEPYNLENEIIKRASESIKIYEKLYNDFKSKLDSIKNNRKTIKKKFVSFMLEEDYYHNLIIGLIKINLKLLNDFKNGDLSEEKIKLFLEEDDYLNININREDYGVDILDFQNNISFNNDLEKYLEENY